MAKSSDPEAEIANSQPNGADAASLKVKQSDEPTSKSADAGADRQEEEAGLRR